MLPGQCEGMSLELRDFGTRKKDILTGFGGTLFCSPMTLDHFGDVRVQVLKVPHFAKNMYNEPDKSSKAIHRIQDKKEEKKSYLDDTDCALNEQKGGQSETGLIVQTCNCQLLAMNNIMKMWLRTPESLKMDLTNFISGKKTMVVLAT